MLTVNDLHFDYVDYPLLRFVNFALGKGELLYLRGDNGCGKTTLLKLLAGILTPGQGEILYDNQAIAEDLSGYQQQICYIGHKPGVSLLLNVKENLAFDLKKERSVDLNALLDQLALSEVGDLPCGLLSAGQKRKVALLRLKISSASLWLLDEPFVALDQKSQVLLGHWCEEHMQSGGQIVLTSHQELPFTHAYKEYLL